MKRLALSSLLLISVVAAQAKPRPIADLFTSQELKPAESSRISSFTNDTIYFGGTRWAPDSMRWEAIKDSVWTFDTGVGSFIKEPGKTYPGVDPYKPDGFHGGMEGWTGWDLTARPVNFFRRLSSADPRWLGSPCVGATAGLDGDYSFWVGVLPSEADSLCFASGKGYGNVWHVCLEHGFDYFGGPATLAFTYRNDTESGFDITHVYCDTGGTYPVEVTTYTGVVSGTESLPMTQGIELPVVPKPIKIKFCVDSDGAWSDQDGLYPTDCGAFALDDVSIQGAITHATDFESSNDGWLLSPPEAGLGRDLSNLAALQDLPQLPNPPPAQCTLRDSVLVFFDPATSQHPYFQDNVVISPWIDFDRHGLVGRKGSAVILNGYFDLPLRNYLFVESMTQWYPDTCRATGKIRLSDWTSNGFAYYYGNSPVCGRDRQIDFSGVVPPNIKELRVAVGVKNYCPFYMCEDGGGGSNNSTPWFDNLRFATYPIKTIQDAIDQASSGDTVWVPPGTYTGSGNVDLTFRGKNIVLKSTQGPEVTVIDGQGGSRGLILDHGEDSTSVVIGLSFANCSASQNSTGSLDGGAVFLGSGVSARFENCVFRDSKADRGGGLFATGASPQFEHCRFSKNLQGAGAFVRSAVFMDCVFDSNSWTGAYTIGGYPQFISCLFQNNNGTGATLDGHPFVSQCNFIANSDAGLHLYYSGQVLGSTFNANGKTGLTFGIGYGIPACVSVVEVKHCTFSENQRGGIFGCGGTVDSCLIQRNEGGGVWSGGMQLRHCRILENEAAFNGGGVELNAGLIYNCIISANRARFGGGVHISTPEYVSNLEAVHIRNCVISGNKAEKGGGIYVGYVSPWYSRPSLEGTTVSSNWSAFGGGIYVGSTRFDVSRSIIWGNAADTAGTQIYLSDPDSATTLVCSNTDPFGVLGPGLIHFYGPQVFRDPLFCGAALAADAPTTDGDYNLSFDSPCLPMHSPCDSLIGAIGEGCDVVSVLPPPTPEDPPFLKTPGIHAGPNPFTRELTIHYLSPIGTDPRLEIYSVDGRLIGKWALRPGSGSVNWDGRDPIGKPVASGIYLLRYIAGDLRVVRRVVRITG